MRIAWLHQQIERMVQHPVPAELDTEAFASLCCASDYVRSRGAKPTCREHCSTDAIDPYATWRSSERGSRQSDVYPRSRSFGSCALTTRPRRKGKGCGAGRISTNRPS